MSDIQLTEEQQLAVELILTARFGCITGGPGTGKTTLVRQALSAARSAAPPKSIALVAPTGKAAKRLSEATGTHAHTIHRFLGLTPGNMYASKYIEEGIVIADEASMVDTELMAALMRACSDSRARLILVGDAHQLPSVGPGMVFRELLACGSVPKVELTVVQRAAQESWIGRNAPKILAGAMPELSQGPDFNFHHAPNVSHVIGSLKQIYAAVQPNSEPMLLTPQNKGPLGTVALNNMIQELYNAPTSRAWSVDGQESWSIDINDPVIQTRNDYDLDVFNGEMGDVVDLTKDTMIVRFDDRHVRYAKKDFYALRLAYALTVHKSQGSEAPHVIMITHPSHAFMLSRPLFYTGVTRSKGAVTLIGTEGAIAGALANTKVSQRHTLLGPRLSDAEKTSNGLSQAQ